MDQMAAQAAHVGTEIIYDIITKVDFSGTKFRAWSDAEVEFEADAPQCIFPPGNVGRGRAKRVSARTSRARGTPTGPGGRGWPRSVPRGSDASKSSVRR